MSKLTNMQYFRNKYRADDSTYLCLRTADGEPWCDVSICLAGYDMTPEDENHIYIPTYKMDSDTIGYIKSTIIKREICSVPIGYGTGLYVELVDNWKDLAAEL